MVAVDHIILIDQLSPDKMSCDFVQILQYMWDHAMKIMRRIPTSTILSVYLGSDAELNRYISMGLTQIQPRNVLFATVFTRKWCNCSS